MAAPVGLPHGDPLPGGALRVELLSVVLPSRHRARRRGLQFSPFPLCGNGTKIMPLLACALCSERTVNSCTNNRKKWSPSCRISMLSSIAVFETVKSYYHALCSECTVNVFSVSHSFRFGTEREENFNRVVRRKPQGLYRVWAQLLAFGAPTVAYYHKPCACVTFTNAR